MHEWAQIKNSFCHTRLTAARDEQMAQIIFLIMPAFKAGIIVFKSVGKRADL